MTIFVNQVKPNIDPVNLLFLTALLHTQKNTFFSFNLFFIFFSFCFRFWWWWNQYEINANLSRFITSSNWNYIVLMINGWVKMRTQIWETKIEKIFFENDDKFVGHLMNENFINDITNSYAAGNVLLKGIQFIVVTFI